MNDVNTVLKAVMHDRGVTNTDLAKLFDVSPQAIYNKFRRGTWDITEVVKMLEYMDCKLFIEYGTIKRYQL